TAVHWVVGISEAGYREHLGVWLGASESLESWSRVFSDLVQRGLEGVSYVVSDEHVGLLQALRRYFPEAEHQRCTVHYLRNALSKTSSKALEAELKSALKDVWAAPGLKEAKARLARLVDSLRERHPSLADWLEETAEETLGFFSLPDPAHRRRLASTNGIEHDHAEIRRRTRVVRIFCSVPQFVGHSKRGGESLFPPELSGRFHPVRRVWGHLVIVPEPAFELADHALCAPQLGGLHVVAPEGAHEGFAHAVRFRTGLGRGDRIQAQLLG